MEVVITYDLKQLDMAVKFISKHNKYFAGQSDNIRNSIFNHMKELALNPDHSMIGTMGYMLIGDMEEEGMDRDTNSMFFEITVDPALGKRGSSTWEQFTVTDDIAAGEVNNG